MKVQQFTNNSGNKVNNQFILTEEGRGALGNFVERTTFQSYDSIIAIKTLWDDGIKVELDRDTWDYSNTTGKYRNQFLNETKTETQKKIDSGEYTLTNLN